MTGRAQFAALVMWSGRELLRTRTALLGVLLIVVVFLVTGFMASLAVTETATQHVVFYAGLLRPTLVPMFGLSIIVNLVRDLDDRVFDSVLSRPVARRTWYLAKFSALVGAAGITAAVAALPLLFNVSGGDLAVWAGSLACELVLVAALALACALSLGQVAPAFCAVAAFYVLSRAIAAILLLSEGPTVDLSQPVNRAIAWGLSALAHVLPDLSRYTLASWLVEGTSGAELQYVLIQTALYSLILVALGLIDFERRSL